MIRRAFLTGSVAALVALFVPRGCRRRERAWTPRPGDLVEIVAHPNFFNGSLAKKYRLGVVLGPMADPEVLNEHYRHGEQLYLVDCGMWKAHCYADELVRRVRRGTTT